jgi:hypothetical protein
MPRCGGTSDATGAAMRSLLPLAVFALSCSTTRSKEMTAVEHRNEAQLHEQQAARERAQYNPDAERSLPIRGPMAEVPGADVRTYNPTEGHLFEADRQMREAARDLAAAKRLEAFEDVRCKDLAPAVRSACPLLASSVSRVVETDRGVKLYLKPDVDVADTHRRLDCHLAYAEAQGFTRPSCPLFVKGMTIALQRSPQEAIELYAGERQVADVIKAQARRIFLGQLPVSQR